MRLVEALHNGLYCRQSPFGRRLEGFSRPFPWVELTVLDGCVAKLDRADSVIRDLAVEHDAFISTQNQFATPIGKIEAGIIEQHKRITEPIHPPPLLAVLVGDVLHEYRSTLDHVMWALTPTAKRNDSTSFPIFEDKDKFQKYKNADKRYKCLAPDIQRILCDAQPCLLGAKAKGHELWLLHRLNIVDKHKVLLLSKSAGFSPSAHGSIVLDKPRRLGPGEFGAMGSVTTSFSLKSDGDSTNMSTSVGGEGDTNQPISFAARVGYGLYFSAECGPAANLLVPHVVERIRRYIRGPKMFGNDTLVQALRSVQHL